MGEKTIFFNPFFSSEDDPVLVGGGSPMVANILWPFDAVETSVDGGACPCWYSKFLKNHSPTRWAKYFSSKGSNRKCGGGRKAICLLVGWFLFVIGKLEEREKSTVHKM
jgi:hypothetical protein